MNSKVQFNYTRSRKIDFTGSETIDKFVRMIARSFVRRKVFYKVNWDDVDDSL